MSDKKPPLTPIQQLAFAALSMRAVVEKDGLAYECLGRAVGCATMGLQNEAVRSASIGVAQALAETEGCPRDEGVILQHGPKFVTLVARISKENWLALPI